MARLIITERHTTLAASARIAHTPIAVVLGVIVDIVALSIDARSRPVFAPLHYCKVMGLLRIHH